MPDDLDCAGKTAIDKICWHRWRNYIVDKKHTHIITHLNKCASIRIITFIPNTHNRCASIRTHAQCPLDI